uniref:Uncharacterized protein n=1 Tax=Rhizophora mucronata TaxID=61149 RepID=A0A2P2L194_RHIMU
MVALALGIPASAATTTTSTALRTSPISPTNHRLRISCVGWVPAHSVYLTAIPQSYISLYLHYLF